MKTKNIEKIMILEMVESGQSGKDYMQSILKEMKIFILSTQC
jgi:hypothetical protein